MLPPRTDFLSRFCRLLILVLHHPYLQAESFLPLFPHATPLSTVEGTPSPSNTSLTANEVIHHPQLAQLLLALYTLLIAVPQLPLIRSIQENYGGPAPPSPVGEVLSSHPQLALRTLAWQVASQWLGWKGPKKEELRRKYVYDPALDTENGKDDMLKFDVPLRDPSLPRRPEECLQFWPRLPEYPTARARAAGGLTVTTEVPQMSAWSLEEHFKRFSELEWTVERATFHNPLSKDEGNSITSLPMNENDLSPLLANIAGISICKEGYIASICKPSSSKGSRDVVEQVDVSATLPSPDVFVSTSPAISALRQLAVHVSARLPVLLSSPPSAGKSVTLHHLHYLLYSSSVAGSKSQQEIVTINLADKSLDAKSLLGTLTSSPTEPGAFVFAEGSLTRAVKYGRWVVLEDVDKASDEVLSTVSELVERVRNRAQSAIGGGWGGVQSNGIGVHAGGEWVEAAENFMLFATRSVPAVAAQAQSSTSAKHHATPSFFGSQYWSEVWMDLPSHDEIQAIVEGRFPRLSKAIADTLVQTWAGIAEAANSLYSTSNTGLARSVGIRDLLKWCRRVEAALPADIIINTISTNPKFQDEVFLEAKDVFLSSLSARTVVYDGIVLALQTGLELSRERIDWALQSRVPEVISSGEKEGSHIQFGRVLLRKRKAHKQPKSSSRPYALTKPFLVLLEELAVCVQCHEPALLVGETGTGKTTAVSQLAEMLGHGLTSLNLSNQTEASDLLGGFRPINEAEEVARELATFLRTASSTHQVAHRRHRVALSQSIYRPFLSQFRIFKKSGVRRSGAESLQKEEMVSSGRSLSGGCSSS